MRLSLFVFLATNRCLRTVFADSSSVRGGAPSDLVDLIQYDHDNEEPISAWEEDHVDLTSPLQRKLLDGEMFDDDLFERTFFQQSRHRAMQNDIFDEDDCVEDHNVDYFDIDVFIQPKLTHPTDCQPADMVMLGHDINAILWKYGVGKEGEGDQDAIFVAGVCPQPTLQQRRQLGLTLQPHGYIYTGIGGCRHFCSPDDFDARLLLENNDMELFQKNEDSRQQRKLASDWFENTFKPELETTLENAISSEVAPLHRGCVGWSPTIEVNVKGVNRFEDLESPCSAANPGTVGLLKTFNLHHILLNTKPCETCVKIDFSTLMRGDWVKKQYFMEHGVTITAWSSANLCITPNNAARIFDTSISDIAPDLGSPNESCGGPGVGDGGRRGSGGENCKTVGSKYTLTENMIEIGPLLLPLFRLQLTNRRIPLSFTQMR